MSDSPNPSWKPGEKIDAPFDEMQSINLQELSIKEIYTFLIGTVLPRPISFVSTVSKSGVGNLAPFSFFNAVSSDPPALMLAIGNKPEGGIKDSGQNILDTGEFVVNTAAEWLIEPLVHCGGRFPADVNEMEITGLTPVASEVVKPPRVKESPVQFECTLLKHTDLGGTSVGSTTMFFGKIERVHIAKEAYVEGKIDYSKIRSVGRMGMGQFGMVENLFHLKIPRV